MPAWPSVVGANGILRHLSSKTLAMIEPHLHKVKLSQGTVLHEAGEAITNVYFPLSGMVSMLAVLKSGEAIEAGVIGREGYVGGYIGVRGWRAFGHAVMQLDGRGPASQCPPFSRRPTTFATICAFSPMAISRSCISRRSRPPPVQALHPVEARMCRWLLQAQDAVGGDTLGLTQEYLSHMMGVRRTSVSGSANKLQEEGLITYKRGTIRILDRKALEKRACECYAARAPRRRRRHAAKLAVLKRLPDCRRKQPGLRQTFTHIIHVEAEHAGGELFALASSSSKRLVCALAAVSTASLRGTMTTPSSSATTTSPGSTLTPAQTTGMFTAPSVALTVPLAEIAPRPHRKTHVLELLHVAAAGVEDQALGAASLERRAEKIAEHAVGIVGGAGRPPVRRPAEFARWRRGSSSCRPAAPAR